MPSGASSLQEHLAVTHAEEHSAWIGIRAPLISSWPADPQGHDDGWLRHCVGRHLRNPVLGIAMAAAGLALLAGMDAATPALGQHRHDRG